MKGMDFVLGPSQTTWKKSWIHAQWILCPCYILNENVSAPQWTAGCEVIRLAQKSSILPCELEVSLPRKEEEKCGLVYLRLTSSFLYLGEPYRFRVPFIFKRYITCDVLHRESLPPFLSTVLSHHVKVEHKGPSHIFAQNADMEKAAKTAIFLLIYFSICLTNFFLLLPFLQRGWPKGPSWAPNSRRLRNIRLFKCCKIEPNMVWNTSFKCINKIKLF